MQRTVLFVCLHGAGKSRMAAAFFNRAAPRGWEANTAGVAPQEEMSANVISLIAGSDAENFLDISTPRPIAAVPDPARVVAIDCDIPGADRWNLAHQTFDEGMRDELRRRAEALARVVGDG